MEEVNECVSTLIINAVFSEGHPAQKKKTVRQNGTGNPRVCDCRLCVLQRSHTLSGSYPGCGLFYAGRKPGAASGRADTVFQNNNARESL